MSSVNTVFSPFPLFTDDDGDPLEAGFLYIGAEGQNAETSPVAVYWDAAKTQPAAQPIRTLNGYPSRDGTPSQVFTNAGYSITVRDRNGSLVFSDLEAGFRIVLSVERFFDDMAALAADTTAFYTEGTILNTRAESYAFSVAATGAADQDRTTAGGVKLYAQPLAGQFHTEQFAGADIGAQFNAAVAAAKRDRDDDSSNWMNDQTGVKVTPGTYAQTTAMEISGVSSMTFDFTGAQITNFAGSITSLKIVAAPNCTIIRPMFNLRNNNNADQAIWIAGQASYTKLIDPMVMGNSSNAGFAAIRLQQGTISGLTPATRDNGSFWVTIERPWVRKLSGSDSNTIAVGIDVQGAHNALRVIDGRISNVGTGVLVQNQDSSTASGISNDIQIILTAFEGFTDAVKWFTTDVGDAISGGTVSFCRFETGTNALSMSGFSASPTAPVMLIGNTVISSTTNYVVSGNNAWYNSLDGFWTPGTADARLNVPGGLTLDSAGVGPSLFVSPRVNANGGSVQLLRSDGVTIDGRIGQRSGGGLEIDGGTSGFVKISANRINFSGIPTASTGVSGDVWNDAGTLKIVP